MSSFYPNSSTIGVDFNNSSATALFTPGTHLQGNADSEFVYCYCSGAVSATGQAVVISATGTAAAATVALGVAVKSELGFAQIAVADTYYAWICKRGNGVAVQMSSTTASAGVLYIGTTAGHLATTASSATVTGVSVTGSSATATSWVDTVATITWPRIAYAVTES